MKKVSFITLLLLAPFCLLAQDLAEAEVPRVVVNVFHKTFPKASKVEWEKKIDGYNVEFDIGRRDHEVWINDQGQIVKHKKELRSSELPKPVRDAIAQQYKGFRIDDADQFETGKKFYYKAELKKSGEERKVIFDQVGKVSTINL